MPVTCNCPIAAPRPLAELIELVDGVRCCVWCKACFDADGKRVDRPEYHDAKREQVSIQTPRKAEPVSCWHCHYDESDGELLKHCATCERKNAEAKQHGTQP